MLKRRHLLMAGAGGLALLAAMRYRMPSSEAADERFPVSHTDAEWRTLLAPAPDGAQRRGRPSMRASMPLPPTCRPRPPSQSPLLPLLVPCLHHDLDQTDLWP